MSTKSNFSSIRPSRNNFGWWLLAALLVTLLLGFIYEFIVDTLGVNIYLIDREDVTYFDVFMFLGNQLFRVLMIFNPLLAIFTSFQFNEPFSPGDKYFVITETLAEASIITLQISLYSIAIGFVLALFLAVVLVRPGRVYGLKNFSQAYIDFFRSTPLLVQMFLIYFGFTSLVQSFGIQFILYEFEAAVIALSLNTAAYQAEIIRGGILAIPTGQTEAARGLGMTSTQTMRYVILPQALRIIIPPFTNEGINIFLNSSLASVISLNEITRKAKNLAARYFITFDVYLLAAMFYFVMAFSLAKLTKRFEKKYRIPGLGVHHD